MKIEQIYTGCLAQGAYYIVSGNEAAIIDPLRETKPYIERLNPEIEENQIFNERILSMMKLKKSDLL